MKWGKKKPSSSRPSLISHVFPVSWLAKFKQMSISSGQEHAKLKRKEKWNSVPLSPPQYASASGGRFYGGEGDAFWRISFGEDGVDGKKNLRSGRCDSDNESCRSNATRANGKEAAFNFSNMVSEARKLRGLPREVEILPEMDAFTRENVAEIRTPRLRVEKGKGLRKIKQRVLEENQMELHEGHEAEETTRKVVTKNIFEYEKGRRIGMNERVDSKLTASDSREDCYMATMNSRDNYSSKIEVDSVFTGDLKDSGEISVENLRTDWQKLKERKIGEVKSRGEKQRKSMYISRELQRRKPKHHGKVRLYSPRTPSKVEVCRIKALEDMRKSKIKMKKKEQVMSMEGFDGLESFAVVKCSFDPQKDFGDSMMEMIQEKRISQPDELEELLACYLTLNSDAYHDLIIKVFRQVWFDLNKTCFDAGIEDEQCYYD